MRRANLKQTGVRDPAQMAIKEDEVATEADAAAVIVAKQVAALRTIAASTTRRAAEAAHQMSPATAAGRRGTSNQTARKRMRNVGSAAKSVTCRPCARGSPNLVDQVKKTKRPTSPASSVR